MVQPLFHSLSGEDFHLAGQLPREENVNRRDGPYGQSTPFFVSLT